MRKYIKKISTNLVIFIMFNVCILPELRMAEASIYQHKDYNSIDDGRESENKSCEASVPMTFKERLLAKQKLEENNIRMSSLRSSNNAYIPAGLKLKVRLTQDVSSKTRIPNTPLAGLITGETCDNVFINDVIVIKKGTGVMGRIKKARKAGGLGRRGKLEIEFNELCTVNGIYVPLKGSFNGKGKSDGGAGVLFTAVTMLGGFLMKGTNVTYPAGTIFEVEVREDVDLECTKDQLAKVMTIDKSDGVYIETK